MAISKSAARDLQAKMFPTVDLELEDGSTVSLRSPQTLTDAEYDRLVVAQEAMTAFHEEVKGLDDDSAEVSVRDFNRRARETMVDVLAAASTDPAKVLEFFEGEPISLVQAVLKEFERVTKSAEGN